MSSRGLAHRRGNVDPARPLIVRFGGRYCLTMLIQYCDSLCFNQYCGSQGVWRFNNIQKRRIGHLEQLASNLTSFGMNALDQGIK